jgi:hypothetical protein
MFNSVQYNTQSFNAVLVLAAVVRIVTPAVAIPNIIRSHEVTVSHDT